MGKKFRWSDAYNTGIGKIDEQHCRFLELLGGMSELDLPSAFNQLTKAHRKRLFLMLIELREYATKHFATEERMLMEAGYPGVLQHKKLHNAFIRAVLDHEDRLIDGSLTVCLDLQKFLGKWWLDHILREDMKFAKFMNQPLVIERPLDER